LVCANSLQELLDPTADASIFHSTSTIDMARIPYSVNDPGTPAVDDHGAPKNINAPYYNDFFFKYTTPGKRIICCGPFAC
jgi:hypothetical protein